MILYHKDHEPGDRRFFHFMNPRYKNLFMVSSLQFCGNIEEYFSQHCERLVAFIVMPRLKNKGNLVRVYESKKLILEKRVWSSENIFLYYFSWYLFHILFMLKYFSRKDHLIVYSPHPISFFAMSIQKLMRHITFVYFVGDFFPPMTHSLRLFEKLKKFYHDRIPYATYLSDIINEKMNGKILNTMARKTVMWGVKPKLIKRNLPKNTCALLFVGLVKPGQGLEFILRFLKSHKDYTLNIIGNCSDDVYRMYQKTILDYGITDRVFFPNKFFSDLELDEISKTCHMGVALYEVSDKSSTFYTDPGKVKAYTEMGLPVVMSNISAVAPYIKKFHAGEIVSLQEKSIETACVTIKENYRKYKDGVDSFNKFFYYETYYNSKLNFLEQIYD